jgi:hypothetical protein
MRTKKTKKEDFTVEVEQLDETILPAEQEPTPPPMDEDQPEPTPEPEPIQEPAPEPEQIQEPEPTKPTSEEIEPTPSEDEPVKKARKPYTKRNKADLIDDIKKDYKPKDDNKGQVVSVGVNKKKVDLSKYVSGTLLIMLIDSLLPNLMLYTAKYIAPEKYKNAKVQDLQMTFEERKQIEPLANEVIVVLIGELSPLEAFLIFTAVIYGSKMLTL